MQRLPRRGFTVVELIAVVIILAIVVALLLPAVQSARESALRSRAKSHQRDLEDQMNQDVAGANTAPLPRARVQKFAAKVTLTPKLSVGTVTPESIYEARFEGKILAVHPKEESGECEIALPLPPQIISLADLSITAAEEQSDMVVLRDGRLLWRGTLSNEPTPIDVRYSAVGKGLYELSVAPGGILDEYEVSLIAKGSDVRLLELSLQPTSLERSGSTSTYRWTYEKLLFGQPVRVDVLGIAPIDRLGELTWLGPISVILFGILVGLVVQAAAATRFDLWTLLLTVGTFAGAYPLMYFAQEYIPLGLAVVISAAIAIAIIGVRAMTLMGFRLGLVGVVVPAVVILSTTLVATIWSPLQGILLTSEILVFFVAAMILMPKINAATSGFWGVTREATAAAASQPPETPAVDSSESASNSESDQGPERAS